MWKIEDFLELTRELTLPFDVNKAVSNQIYLDEDTKSKDNLKYKKPHYAQTSPVSSIKHTKQEGYKK